MDFTRFQEVLSDEAFAQALFELDTAEEVQDAFKINGIDLTLEEINELNGYLNRYVNGELTEEEKNTIELFSANEGDELNDSQLEAVSGGTALLIPVMGYDALSALRASNAMKFLNTNRNW